MWEYIPDQQDGVKLSTLKSTLSSTKGLGTDKMEKLREKTLDRYIGWKREGLRPTDDILFTTISENDELKCITNSTFFRVVDSMSACMNDLLLETATQQANLKYQKAQVLVICNGLSEITPFLVAFFLEHGLTFAFIPTSFDSNHLLKQITEVSPSIIITDTHTSVQLEKLMASREIHEKSNKGTVLDKENVTDLNIEYSGLITSWTASNMLKNVQKSLSKTLHTEYKDFRSNLLGVIAVGPVIPDECSFSLLKRLPYLYQMVCSHELSSPLFIRDMKKVLDLSNYSFQVMQPWNFADVKNGEIIINGPTIPRAVIPKPAETRKEEFILSDLEDKVFDTTNPAIGNAYRNDLIEKYKRVTMPESVRESLTKCFNLKEEWEFYTKVKAMVTKRPRNEAAISLAYFDNCLYSALLDELERIAPKILETTSVEDVTKFLDLRISLTAQSVQLQLIDFRFRFSEALRLNQVVFNFIEKPSALECTSPRVGEVETDLGWLHNNFCLRSLKMQPSGFEISK